MTTLQQHAFPRTDRTRLGVWWWTTDHLLLGATAILIVIGVLLCFGNSPAAAARMNIGDPFHFAVRQSIFALFAAAILIGVSMMSPRGHPPVGLLHLPRLDRDDGGADVPRPPRQGGDPLGGDRRLFAAAVRVHEAGLIVLASWMFAEGQKGQGVPGVTIAFVLYVLAAGLLLVQPDVGQTVLITIAFGAAFFMAGVPMKWILGLGGAALAGSISLYFVFDHVASRVNKFLSPETTDTHQIDRAREAIAAGAWFGRGPGEGVLKRQVPDVHTDFAYAGAAEEYGLVFSLFLIALFGFLIVRGLYKAMKLSDPFEQVAAGGLFVLVGQQAFINVAVNLNLIPTKGMTLPFISYGGSSMLAMGLTMGMALALTRKRPGAYETLEAPAGAFA